MIIDCHAHLVAPDALYAHRAMLLADGGYHVGRARISKDAIAESAASNVALMDAVGTDVQLISPRPFHQGHSMRPARLVHSWVESNNDVIAQTVALHPTRFAGIGGLPITPGNPVSDAFPELRRTVEEFGFVGVLVNPDPAEGTAHGPGMDDRYWFPLYELLVELDVPMQIHSAGCYSGRETYSEHFITEESITILSMIRGDVFKHFPGLRVIVSHGGGSVPYQLGRWQAEVFHPALGDPAKVTPFEQRLRQFYFDTILHYPLALELLLKTVGPDRVLFGTERPGSGSTINPATGQPFDDLKPVIESLDCLTDDERRAVFEGNARRVFPRLKI